MQFKAYKHLKDGKGTYPFMREEALLHQVQGYTVRIRRNAEWGFFLQITGTYGGNKHFFEQPIPQKLDHRLIY